MQRLALTIGLLAAFGAGIGVTLAASGSIGDLARVDSASR